MNRDNSVTNKIEGIIHWFVFNNDNLIVPKNKNNRIIPIITKADEEPPFKITTKEYLGNENGIHYFAADTFDFQENEDFTVLSIRAEYKNISSDLFSLIAYATGVIHWSRNFNYCGKCGSKTVRVEKERAKKCPNCGLISYPRISPAIIVAIKKENKILLAHNAHFRENHYSTIAGFIEPGEKAEEAVVREVYEEVGIHIKNIQYVTSQAWPFPDSLMLGFIAEWDNSEIEEDHVEITDAHWFDRESIEKISIPTKKAIARTLIEKVVGELDVP